MAMGSLKWKDEELLDSIFETFKLYREKYDLISLVSIFYSFAMIYPKQEVFESIAQ